MDDATITRLFDKIEAIQKDTSETKVIIAKLPCGIHDERFKSHKESHDTHQAVHRRMWGILMLILTGLVGIGMKAFK